MPASMQTDRGSEVRFPGVAFQQEPTAPAWRIHIRDEGLRHRGHGAPAFSIEAKPTQAAKSTVLLALLDMRTKSEVPGGTFIVDSLEEHRAAPSPISEAAETEIPDQIDV